MTLTIELWHALLVLEVLLIVAPFIYAAFRRSPGDYDFEIDTFIVLCLCWGAALGLGIGLIFGRWL